jgi:hypothetical protein
VALLPLLFFAFFALGAASRTWWSVSVPVVISAGVAVFLIANNGWYGAGWGDFGVELNLLAAALSVLGAAAGVAFGKAARGARGRRT